MNRQQFNDWLKANNACTSAVWWCEQHPDLSVQELMSTCPRGEWILWVYNRVGYAPEVLAPVAYRAATRAMGYAADSLDRAGIQHGLRGLVITDGESARAAARAAARGAWDARAARAAAYAAEAAAWATEAAAWEAAWEVALAAARAAAAWDAAREAAGAAQAQKLREILTRGKW